MRKINRKFSSKLRGTTLIEVLVSIVILSIGLLGTAGLLVNSMRSVSEQGNTNGASIYARELGERMMANRNVAMTTTGNPYLFDTSVSGTWPNAGSLSCGSTFCTAADRATWDVAEWGKRVRTAGSTGSASIPGIKVKVCLDSLTAASGTATQWACTPGSNPLMVIKMAWASKGATGVVENTASTLVPRAVFIVTPGAN